MGYQAKTSNRICMNFNSRIGYWTYVVSFILLQFYNTTTTRTSVVALQVSSEITFKIGPDEPSDSDLCSFQTAWPKVRFLFWDHLLWINFVKSLRIAGYFNEWIMLLYSYENVYILRKHVFVMHAKEHSQQLIQVQTEFLRTVCVAQKVLYGFIQTEHV